MVRPQLEKQFQKNKSVPQSELGPVNQKNIAIKISFKKIFEGLQEKNTTPQEINSEFAKEVDKELRDILIRLTFKRFNEEYEATYWKKLALPIMILMSGQPLVKENKGK